MIDFSKCTPQDFYYGDENDFVGAVYYFILPEVIEDSRFDISPEDNVVSMCVSLTEYGDDTFDLAISPTITIKKKTGILISTG